MDPPFLPGPSYMLSGPLLLAIAGTFPIGPQWFLDRWRGFEDKYLGMQVEQLTLARGLPVRIVGRQEHYLDVAHSANLKKPVFCDDAWRTKLGVQVISFNESHPLKQFACPAAGWEWPAT